MGRNGRRDKAARKGGSLTVRVFCGRPSPGIGECQLVGSSRCERQLPDATIVTGQDLQPGPLAACRDLEKQTFVDFSLRATTGYSHSAMTMRVNRENEAVADSRPLIASVGRRDEPDHAMRTRHTFAGT